jgi:hypothetical protein
MVKTAITKSDVERHQKLFNRTGFPPSRDYLVLDGTRAQLEGWEPWNIMQANHPNYECYYINLDGENGDPTKYDIVNYLIPQPAPATPFMRSNGAGAGDTAIIRYNSKEGFMSDEIIFLKGNIEQNQSYYIIEE